MDYYRSRKKHEELPDNIALEEKDPVEENYRILAKCLKPLIQELQTSRLDSNRQNLS